MTYILLPSNVRYFGNTFQTRMFIIDIILVTTIYCFSHFGFIHPSLQFFLHLSLCGPVVTSRNTTFNIPEFYTPTTQCISVIPMNLRTNSDLFPHASLADFYITETEWVCCALQLDNNTEFKLNSVFKWLRKHLTTNWVFEHKCNIKLHYFHTFNYSADINEL